MSAVAHPAKPAQPSPVAGLHARAHAPGGVSIAAHLHGRIAPSASRSRGAERSAVAVQVRARHLVRVVQIHRDVLDDPVRYRHAALPGTPRSRPPARLPPSDVSVAGGCACTVPSEAGAGAQLRPERFGSAGKRAPRVGGCVGEWGACDVIARLRPREGILRLADVLCTCIPIYFMPRCALCYVLV